MDKYEYNLRNEEINTLIGRREFQKAVAIADTIDWTKVRSVKTLCKISDLYKINKRYKESKILLEQALVRFPNGKSIVSSLCELCIKMDDIIGATEYYKQFVQMAPTDNIKFILLYKIYEAQEATLDERIEVLESLKKRERIEKWCYELAKLYHRTGLTSKCVEECDDLILWFREGKYVKKAMELKMLHQQLTQPQDVLYQNMLDPDERAAYIDQTASHSAVDERVEEEPDDVLVKTVDVGQYSTINIQKALEESIKGTLGGHDVYASHNDSAGIIEQGDDVTKIFSSKENDDDIEEKEQRTNSVSAKYENIEVPVEEYSEETSTEKEYYSKEATSTEEYYPEEATSTEEYYSEEAPAEEYYSEEVPAAEEYYPEEAPQNEVEVETEEPTDNVTAAIIAPMLQDTAEMQELFFEEEVDDTKAEAEVEVEESVTAEMTYIEEPGITESEVVEEESDAEPEDAEPEKEDVASQVVFPDMPVSGDTIIYNKGDIVNQVANAVLGSEGQTGQIDSNAVEEAEKAPSVNLDNASKEELMDLIDKKVAEALENAMKGHSIAQKKELKRDDINQIAPPTSMQKMLSQEYNGQISLVVPEQEQVEKQITGQINISEYLESWEDTKRESQKKNAEAIKQKLMQETGNLLTEFEAQARDSILDKLESENTAANAKIDADKEYEEYLKKVYAEAEGDTDETSVEKEEPGNIVDSEQVAIVVPEETDDEINSSEENLPEVEAENEDQVDEVTEDTEADTIAEEAENNEDNIISDSEADVSDLEDEVEELAEEPEDIIEEEVITKPESDEDSDATSDEVEELEEEPEDAFEKEILKQVEEEEKEELKNSNVTSEVEEEAKKEEKSEEESEDSEDSTRDLTEEELSLFSQFFQTKKARRNLTKSLDNISLASYTGNVFVTGDMGEDPIELAKNVVQYAKNSDANFSGKIGKVTGASLNGKDIAVTVEKMSNGGLIIERAGDMREETVQSLIKVLNQENLGILVVMQDTKVEMNKMYNSYPEMSSVFNIHIEVEELSDDALVAFGRKYAERMEYSIDEMGILALHTRIDEMQTCDHVVTIADVRDIVDDAIDHATRFSVKHITDVLFGKRYDDEDMIILKERDFIN